MSNRNFDRVRVCCQKAKARDATRFDYDLLNEAASATQNKYDTQWLTSLLNNELRADMRGIIERSLAWLKEHKTKQLHPSYRQMFARLERNAPQGCLRSQLRHRRAQQNTTQTPTTYEGAAARLDARPN